jgi:hypothetical protein
MEGRPVETPVEFLVRTWVCHEVNFLEEDLDQPERVMLRSGPYAIRTIKFNLGPPGPNGRARSPATFRPGNDTL